MGKFWGDWRCGGKNGALGHKSGNISETRTDRGKVTYGEPIGTHLGSFKLYHPQPTTASPSPRLGVHTPPKTPLLSREWVKLRTSNLARTITVSIRIIAHEKFWRKGRVGVSRDCPIFSGTPYYLRNGESYRFQI